MAISHDSFDQSLYCVSHLCPTGVYSNISFELLILSCRLRLCLGNLVAGSSDLMIIQEQFEWMSLFWEQNLTVSIIRTARTPQSGTRTPRRPDIKRFYFPGGVPMSPSSRGNQEEAIQRIFAQGYYSSLTQCASSNH